MKRLISPDNIQCNIIVLRISSIRSQIKLLFDFNGNPLYLGKISDENHFVCGFNYLRWSVFCFVYITPPFLDERYILFMCVH